MQLCKRSGLTRAFFLSTKTLKTKIGTRLNIEKSSQIIINVVGAIHKVNKITDRTIMTIKTLGTGTKKIITKINQFTKTTLGQNTNIDHHTHQTLQTIIDHHSTMAGHRNDKVTVETTLIEIAIGKIVGIDRATLPKIR